VLGVDKPVWIADKSAGFIGADRFLLLAVGTHGGDKSKSVSVFNKENWLIDLVDRLINHFRDFWLISRGQGGSR
jgi:hypothetical protein